MLFCTLVIVTGPIWAKGTWGRWWSWDPRLTITLLLWFVYLAYLLLRSFTEGERAGGALRGGLRDRGARRDPAQLLRDRPGGRPLDAPGESRSGAVSARAWAWPFALGALVCLVAFAHLLARRIEVEALRSALAERLGRTPSGPSAADGIRDRRLRDLDRSGAPLLSSHLARERGRLRRDLDRGAL